jgi:putative oxidoreductase
MTTQAAVLTSSDQKEARGGLHIALWVVQGLLALAFIAAGTFKSTTPLDQLSLKMPWVSAVPAWLVRFIGISELAGGLGLVLPSLTRIKPALTALAATGLVAIMVLAAGTHVLLREYGALPINALLGGLALFVAWGRTRKVPISPRG